MKFTEAEVRNALIAFFGDCDGLEQKVERILYNLRRLRYQVGSIVYVESIKSIVVITGMPSRGVSLIKTLNAFGKMLLFETSQIAPATMEQETHWHNYHKEIRCPNCDSVNQGVDSTWRWNGNQWEHRCKGVDPQAGYWNE